MEKNRHREQKTAKSFNESNTKPSGNWIKN